MSLSDILQFFDGLHSRDYESKKMYGMLFSCRRSTLRLSLKRWLQLRVLKLFCDYLKHERLLLLCFRVSNKCRKRVSFNNL